MSSIPPLPPAHAAHNHQPDLPQATYHKLWQNLSTIRITFLAQTNQGVEPDTIIKTLAPQIEQLQLLTKDQPDSIPIVGCLDALEQVVTDGPNQHGGHVNWIETISQDLQGDTLTCAKKGDVNSKQSNAINALGSLLTAIYNNQAPDGELLAVQHDLDPYLTPEQKTQIKNPNFTGEYWSQAAMDILPKITGDS